MITEETVERIARLAKLTLSAEEKERLRREMGNIVAFADKLSELGGVEVSPTTHAVQVENVYREDRHIPACSREELLANAPRQDQACFLVPKVVD